jgi:hypothetical protein
MSDDPLKNKDEKVVNIQKFNPKQTHEFTKEEMPFTLVCNKVINECQNPVAGFIWIYLQSKCPTWKPCKWEIMKRFDISERTYQRHMSYLSATNLIENIVTRDKNGKVIEWKIKVLNGSRFNPKADDYKGTAFVAHTTSQSPHLPPSLPPFCHTAKNGVVDKSSPDKGFSHTAKYGEVEGSHSAKKPHSGKMARYINTRSTSLKKKEKDIINTSPSGEDYMASFESFYSVYPRKKGKQDAIKWFKKNKPTAEFVSTLIEDVTKRTQTEWNGKEPQYLPYPATYLNGKRWEDAIETSAPVKPKYPTPDERAANEQKILEREMKAQAEKKAEIEASRDVKSRIYIGASELMKQQEAHRISLGLSVTEYHEQIILGKNKGTVQKDNI